MDELISGKILVLNAETPARDWEHNLRSLLDAPRPDHPEVFGYELVQPLHLEAMGGPQDFDLTNVELYKRWLDYLVACEVCDGSDEQIPSVLIVDGLTAILGGNTTNYGPWYAAFRQFMRTLDIPNGLVVGHNTIQGGHLMDGVEAQAGPDGLWSYFASNPDNPMSVRRFSVRSRLGGVPVPPMEVRLTDGLLIARTPAPSSDAQPPSEPDQDEVLVVAHRTAAYVAEHPGADGQELTDHVESRSKGQNLGGRAKAVELGLIREEPCGPACPVCVDRPPHHNRRHYRPVDHVAPATD